MIGRLLAVCGAKPPESRSLVRSVRQVGGGLAV